MANVSQKGYALVDGTTHDSRLMTLGSGLLDPPHSVPRRERKPCASTGYVLCLAMIATDPMVVEWYCGGKGLQEAKIRRYSRMWLG